MSTLTLPRTPLRQDATVIGLVGLAHCISHFSQLLLAPLFPWLKDAFDVSYTQLGFLLTIFFVVSCVVQTLSGFWVDRYGPRPILFGGLGAAGRGRARLCVQPELRDAGRCSRWSPASATACSTRWTTRCSTARSARRGSAMPTACTASPAAWAGRWRRRCWCRSRWPTRGASRCCAPRRWPSSCWRVLWLKRGELTVDAAARAGRPGHAPAAEGSLDFLKIPAVWMCFALLLLLRRRAVHRADLRARGGAPAARGAGAPGGDLPDGLHGVQRRRHGGWAASWRRDPAALRAHRRRGLRPGGADGAGWSASTTLPALAVPVLFGAMGFVSGMAGPSRDLLVKRSAPDNATGPRLRRRLFAGWTSARRWCRWSSAR